MTVENQELDEAELFNQAVTDEPVETTETPVVEAEQPEKPETEVIAETPAEAEKPTVDDNAPLVPSWRLREINEEKRRVAEENERLKAELAQSRQAPQRHIEQPKVEKPARPDPLLDPEGYAKAVRDELREEMLNERREDSLLRAREANQTEFDEAYAAAQKAVDPALKARMQGSRDPGKTLLEWHRERKTQAEIGNDLTAYKQRLREEALKDPEFRKAAMEAWRTDAQPQQTNGRPRVELPPSLSGASRSNAALRSENTDVSDGELFREIAG